MFSLVIQERGGGVQVHTFDKAEVSIGRIQGNDIVLPKGNISKRHARIVHRDDDFVVVDLRSTNGTYVNGHKVSSPMVVSEDDKLYLGDFVVQIRRGQVSADSVSPAEDATHAMEPVATGPAPRTLAHDDESVLAVDEFDDASLETATAAPIASPAEPVRPAVAAEGPQQTRTAAAFPAAEPAAALDQTWAAPVEPAAAPVVAAAAVESPTVVAGGTQPAAPVATTTAPALETLSTPQEAHMRALALLRPRAKDTVFAGRDLDHIDFESQWHELESAVFSLVEKARRAGDISTQLDASALTTDLLYEFTALGPVEHLLADESVDEIFVDGFNRISTRKGKELVPVADRGFSSADAYDDIVERLVRTRATMARIDSPLATGRLEDGTWFQVVRRTLAPQGPLLHLVKARHEPQRLEDWVVEGRISERHAAELKRRTVDGRANTLVVSPSPDAAAAVVEAIVAALAPTERFALLEQRPRIALSFGAPAVRFDGAQAESVEAAHLSGAARLVAVDVAPATLARLLSHGATRADGIVASLRARGAEDVPARIRATHETGTPKEAALALAGAALDLVVVVSVSSDGEVHVDSLFSAGADPLTGLALEAIR